MSYLPCYCVYLLIYNCVYISLEGHIVYLDRDMSCNNLASFYATKLRSNTFPEASSFSATSAF